jgi:hypothetical protein
MKFINGGIGREQEEDRHDDQPRQGAEFRPPHQFLNKRSVLDAFILNCFGTSRHRTDLLRIQL